MLISIFYQQEDWQALLISSIISVSIGGLGLFFTYNTADKELKKRDGYIIVTFGWIFMSAFGALPFVIHGAIPTYTDAFFETISGFTTTGASILNDIEAVPKGLLFWRSLTQWIGGMGIIVLTVAILPILGIGGMQLFLAEAPVVTPDKIQPRIKETAKRLWYVYIGLTATEMVLLMLGGMDWFDSINHSFTTMATGGFSTRQDSIAYYENSYIHYVIIVFMFLAGTNFTISYLGLHLRFSKILENEEFKTYLIVIGSLSLIIAFVLFSEVGLDWELSIRDSLFQVISVVTTTGYVTADYTSWTPFLTVVFFILMFIGGSAGSTAGGVKIVRHLILIKNSVLELKRQLHPSGVIPVRFNGNAVTRDISFNILAFIMIYIIIFALGTVIMAMMGSDFETAMGAVATSLGNIGPGIGTVGPVDNFYHLSDASKWFLAFLMMLGRLELFTVLMLFTPYFWGRQ
jgi:trk system potassium uptake protein TrkH